MQHELVKFGDGDRVVEQLEIDRCESTEIIHSTPIVEDCEHLLFARDALELLHREHLKLEVALHAWYVECNLVQQVVHEVESVYLALFGGQIGDQKHDNDCDRELFLDRVFDDLKPLRLIGDHDQRILEVLDHEVGQLHDLIVWGQLVKLLTHLPLNDEKQLLERALVLLIMTAKRVHEGPTLQKLAHGDRLAYVDTYVHRILPQSSIVLVSGIRFLALVQKSVEGV